MPKICQKSMIIFFLARRAKKTLAKGQSLPQELEVGSRSRPFLLVVINSLNMMVIHPLSSNSFRYRQAQIVNDGAFSNKIDNVIQILDALCFKGHKTCIISSKITAEQACFDTL